MTDHDWALTEAQRALKARVAAVCAEHLAPAAEAADRDGRLPSQSIRVLADLGLLGLLLPEAASGRGKDLRTATVVTETIARHGCPSTALCYAMHLAATAALAQASTRSAMALDLLSRLDREGLLGALSCSDPEMSGANPTPRAASVVRGPRGYHLRKRAAWTTSAGQASWYLVQAAGPAPSTLSSFLVLGHEVNAGPSSGGTLGLRASGSGPLAIDVELGPERLIGAEGEGIKAYDDAIDPVALLCMSAVWNGLAMALIDRARTHVLGREHADTGRRVADYPGIQEKLGAALASTNAARAFAAQTAADMDARPAHPHRLPRLWQLKDVAATNVSQVADAMLQAAGGSGYRVGHGLERLLRDAKAAWIIGPANEIARQQTGRHLLFGDDP